jgi:hypothetical protein
MFSRLILALIMTVCAVSSSAQDVALKELPLYGKTINVIGDSYVRNHRRPYQEAWHYLIAEKYSMTYNNYGRNGGCIAFDRSREGFGPSMLVRYAQMTDSADYVLVVAGHNDAVKVGESADSLAMFADSLSLLCERLIDKYPDAKLAFVTPWNVERPGFRQVISKIKDVCASYSIPVFDAASCSGVYVRNENFRRKYFQSANDTAHLNAAGHRLVMNKFEKFLLSL